MHCETIKFGSQYVYFLILFWNLNCKRGHLLIFPIKMIQSDTWWVCS